MRRWPRTVLVVVLLGGCAGSGEERAADPRVDRRALEAIEATRLTLYLPDLPGGTQRLERSTVEDGAVVSRFYVDEEEHTPDIVSQHPTRGAGDLCRAWSLPLYGTGSCESDGTVMRSSFEERTRIVVVRDGTLLEMTVSSDGDPALVDRTLAALQSAPEVEPEVLATRSG